VLIKQNNNKSTIAKKGEEENRNIKEQKGEIIAEVFVLR
jgi:hypothetical protein